MSNTSQVALMNKMNKLMGEGRESADKRPIKVIRDSFTLPENDHQLIALLQERSLGLRLHSTKGEILRAGLHALAKMDDESFLTYINGVEKLKPGRPKKR